MYKVLYFVGGVIVGSAVTYFITKKHMDETIEKEIADFKEQYKAKKEDPKSKVIELNRRKMDIQEELSTANNISQQENYSLFSNPPRAIDIHNGIDEDEDLEYEEVIDTTPPKEGLSDPYTITPEQFVNEEKYFDKVTLEYYDDGILCSEDGYDIITDISRVIGPDALTKFGEFEEDVVYVRNERYSTDYEVIHQHRDFAIIPRDEY